MVGGGGGGGGGKGRLSFMLCYILCLSYSTNGQDIKRHVGKHQETHPIENEI